MTSTNIGSQVRDDPVLNIARLLATEPVQDPGS